MDPTTNMQIKTLFYDIGDVHSNKHLLNGRSLTLGRQGHRSGFKSGGTSIIVIIVQS